MKLDESDRPFSVSEELAGVAVSPNPFGSLLAVRHASGVLRYELIDAVGSRRVSGSHRGHEVLTLEVGSIPAGVYWLRLIAADGERVISV